MSVIYRSILFSAVDRYANLLLFLVATAILSRLLNPAEFGAYAVISALITVISASSQEFGGVNYLIQKTALTQLNIRTAFTITFCMSAIIGAGLFAAAHPIAVAFAHEELGRGIQVAALCFLLMPFSLTPSALLKRDMEFGKLAVCSLVSNVAGTAVSIALALLGFSFMAPVWGMVATNIVVCGALLFYRPDLTVFAPSLAGYRDVVRFGLYSSGISVINVFYNMAPQLFLGRILGFTAVGLYSRATGITQTFEKLVLQVLGPILMPAIVNHKRAGSDLKRLYLDAIELLTAVQWPFLILIAVMAHPIIAVWLGPTWLETVPLVRLLCVAYLALFAACLTYPILVAVGQVKDALRASLISLPPSLAITLGASFISVEAVAASALLSLPFQATVAIFFISRHLGIRPGDLIGAVRKSLVATIGATCGGLAALVAMNAGIIDQIVGLFVAGVLALGCWWACLILTRHPLVGHLYGIVGNMASFAAPASQTSRQRV